MGSLFGGSSGQSGTQYQTQNRSEQTQYDPKYRDYTYNILDRAQSAADTPWQGYDVSNMFAGFTPDQQQAFQQIRNQQGAYQGYFDQGKGALDRAAGYDIMGAAQPYLDAAGNATRPWEAGAGALSASTAGWTTPGAREAYMGDYTQGAINRAHDLTGRNFLEKTMPGINAQFAKGQGQLGRGNYNRFAGQATRDLAGEMAGTSATMMDKAYWNAGNQFTADQNRMLQAGTGLGDLAAQNIGTLSGLAKTGADITTGAVNTGVSVGNAYAQQAGALSNLNLMNTNALLQAGQMQQQQNQLPLTAQYQQWQQQQKWPFEMVNFMNAAQRGLNFGTTQTGSSTSQGSSGQTGTNQPSAAGSVLGVLSSANSLFGKGNVGGLERGYNALFGSGSGSEPTQVAGPAGGYTGSTFDPNTGAYTPYAARGGFIREPRRYRLGGAVSRFARGGRPAFGTLRRAVGGDVPVARGMQMRGAPPMGGMMPPPGGMGGALPAPPAMGGGPFAQAGGLPPAMPMPPALPRGAGVPGALSAMR